MGRFLTAVVIGGSVVAAAVVAPLAGAGDEPAGPAARLERVMLADFDSSSADTVAAAASSRSLARGGVERARPGVLWLGTAAGRMRAGAALSNPLAQAAGSGRAGATVFAGAGSSTDLGVRETPLGLRSYVQLRGRRARSFSWDVSLPGAERLMALADGGIGVLARRAAVAAAGTRGAASSPTVARGWRLVATVSPPVALDGRGRTVHSRLARSGGGRVTLRVGSGGTGPVVARMNWSPVGDLGNGWWSHGSPRPFGSTTWALERGRRTRGGGCGYVERGTLPPGVIEEARDVAVAAHGCRVIVETGRRTQRRRAAGPVAGAAGTTHRNKAFYKNMQEDPVQIDVNSVKDVVDWRWNRSCTRAMKMYDKTDAYGPTGWKLVERHPLKSRRCTEATMQTYAKFKGGQFFPACTGFKVTTIYANNIVQGFPDGKGGYHVYRVTGGPPCYHLLHWDRRRGNKRIY